MKKLLLSLSILAGLSTQAQNLFTENFDAFLTTGWTQTNQSSTVGLNPLWAQGADTVFPAYNGATTSYAASNYNATDTGFISNWLISPTVTVMNGDVITFYARTVDDVLYADRMQFRISTAGDFTTNPSTGPTDLGDFTTLVVDINQNETIDETGFPNVWTQYTYTMTGLTGPTDIKMAFRYYVSDGGPAGANSSYIGVDQLSVDRTLATQEFFTQNFSVYPNPATDVLNISSKNGAIKTVGITDINGRTVKTLNGGDIAAQINISDLNAGVYFVKVSSDAGTGTTKIVKN